MDQERAEKEAGKAAQKVANTTARSAKAAAQAEWERTKLKHADDVRDWATEVERLRQAGVPRKDLPKKPVCPLRPIAGQPERHAPRCRARGASPDEEPALSLDTPPRPDLGSDADSDDKL
jgi:hypothetical protein